ncbi:MAG TPA: hypothetical protein VGL22_11640 [Terracidiphilus sp.]
MRIDNYTRIVLSAIALLLTVIAFRPMLHPTPVAAQSAREDLYIEPGVYMLRSPDGMRQQMGKVVVDLHSGYIWGFPTGSDAPYPAGMNGANPPVSKAYLLGRFDLDSAQK